MIKESLVIIVAVILPLALVDLRPKRLYNNSGTTTSTIPQTRGNKRLRREAGQ